MYGIGGSKPRTVDSSRKFHLFILNRSQSDLTLDLMTVSREGSEVFGAEMQERVNQSVVYSGIRESDGYENFYVQARFVTGLICYPIVCAFGLVGNVLSIIVMCQKQMTSSTNVYLLALAISDCIKLISDFLYFMVILLLEIDFPRGNRAFGFLYPYAHYIFNSSLCISAWLTVSVAVERYIYVCHPTKVKHYCGISRARTISTSVFLIMSLLAIPYAMRYRTVEQYNNTTSHHYYDLQVSDLWMNDTFSTTYIWLQNFLRSIIPLCILIILNTCIIYGMRRCRIGRSKSSRRHRITVMLIVVIIVFLVCITPDAIMSTFFGIGYYEEKFLQRGVREITDLLLLVNSACNFIIYCIFNTIFWRNFVYLFCRPCCGPTVQMEESQIRRLSLVGRPRPSLHVRIGSRKFKDGLLSEV
ncbi:probable G-protein coupled receptor 139 isoform X1 [Haliotis rubra]|uniref:probable G-protein coupled receptor 139 isoform X1 n=2 Tax=Haliotis rubra TaxID=36100 RepID=UPI001EE550C5|nr:probable G-protein coupled receptor 139 isoform X1 [Haliotis rubra]